MRTFRRICVFCGSSGGARPEYRTAAISLVETLIANDIGLVYGGASVGTMGLLARTMQERGGEVIGVIPQLLVDKEVAATNLPDLRIVGSMHERKALMAELSDAFIALPGGLGTLEELFEALTWNQLGLHDKPCGVLNTAGFYDHLLIFLQQAVGEAFLQPEHASMLVSATTPSDLLTGLRRYQQPKVPKWIAALERH